MRRAAPPASAATRRLYGPVRSMTAECGSDMAPSDMNAQSGEIGRDRARRQARGCWRVLAYTTGNPEIYSGFTGQRWRRRDEQMKSGQRPQAAPLPARRFERDSALGELERPPRLGLAVFLALDHAAVAGQEAAALEYAAQLRLEIRERLGEAVAHRAGLAGQSAARYPAYDVILAV